MSAFRGENDNRSTAITTFGPAHAGFLAAGLVVVSIALAPVLALWTLGLGSGAAGTSVMFALVAGGLLAVALLWRRASTVGVRIEPHALILSKGFPVSGHVLLPWHEVANATASVTPFDRWTGGGTLHVEDRTRRVVAVRGLAGAERAARLIGSRVAHYDGVATMLGGLEAMARRDAG